MVKEVMRQKNKKSDLYTAYTFKPWFWKSCYICGDEMKKESVHEISIKWRKKLVGNGLHVVEHAGRLAVDPRIKGGVLHLDSYGPIKLVMVPEMVAVTYGENDERGRYVRPDECVMDLGDGPRVVRADKIKT